MNKKYLKLLLLITAFSSNSLYSADIKNWSIIVNPKSFSEKYLGGYNDEFNKVINFNKIQVIYNNKKTETDGITTIKTTGVKVSIVGRVGNVGHTLYDKVKKSLPKPGCKDSNDVMIGKINILKGSNVLRHNVTASGTERACDPPYLKYGNWSKSIWLDLEIFQDGNTIGILPNLSGSPVKASPSTMAKLGMKVAKELKNIGIKIKIKDPKEIAKNADNIFYKAADDFNKRLAGRSLKIDNKSFFKSKQWSSLSKRFKWRASSSFFKNTETHYDCLQTYNTEKHYINLDYSTSKNKNMSLKVAKQFDTELRKILKPHGKIKENKAVKNFKDTKTVRKRNHKECKEMLKHETVKCDSNGQNCIIM